MLVFTPLMKKRLTRRALAMIERALGYFPELENHRITIGYTRAHLGSASLGYRTGKETRLTIRLKVRKLTYQTIGHELTHLVQGLSRKGRYASAPVDDGSIPCGEKQCDIWTLARNALFCDDPPTYLRLPRVMREHWSVYARDTRRLCRAAIEKRKTYRYYIRWLEAEIHKMSKQQFPAPSKARQLSLPFLN